MSEDTKEIEDVQEDTLVEETEQETAEDSTQETSLSETVLKTLLGESQEEEVELDESTEDTEEESDTEEVNEAKKDDEDEEEEEVDEAKHDDDDEDEDIDEAMHDGDDEEKEEAPKTKAEILNQMYKEMKGMKKSQLTAAFDKLQAMYSIKSEEVDGEKEGDEAAAVAKKSADAAKNLNKGDLLQAAYKMIKSQKKSSLQASYHDLKKEMMKAKSMDESFDLESEVDLLVQADSNLSEDFKTKAQVVFEAAIANKVYDIRTQLEEQFSADLQEEVTFVRETLVEKIDNYLGYVVENWIEENSDVVESQLRSEITEKFITGLQTLFTESYIDVPEAKRDLVSELDEKVKLMDGALEQAESDNEDLQEKLDELLREKIIRENSQDLTSTQVEKLNHLLDGAEFESEEAFTEKVQTVKETFFSGSQEEEIKEATDASGDVEVVVEGTASEQKQTIPADMARYVSALGSLEKNSSFITK
jgi:hypothetical protein